MSYVVALCSQDLGFVLVKLQLDVRVKPGPTSTFCSRLWRRAALEDPVRFLIRLGFDDECSFSAGKRLASIAMSFSVEVWKRSFQRLGSFSDRKAVDAEAEDGFKDVLERHRADFLRAKVLLLEEQISEKDRKIEGLVRENRDKNLELEVLKQALQALEEEKAEWTQKEEIFVAEMQELASALEDKSALLSATTTEARIDKEKCRELGTSLKEKIEQLRCCNDDRDKYRKGLKVYEKELDGRTAGRIEVLEQELAATKLQLNEATNMLKAKDEESARVLKDLDEKQSRLESLQQEVQRLSDRASSLDFSVTALQEKNSKFVEELQAGGRKCELLCDDLGAAEAEIAGNRTTMASLQLKVDLGEQMIQKSNHRIKELETTLCDWASFAQDKDEKLDASEWAVKQLGLHEISRAKTSLADTEAQLLQLRQSHSELERKLMAKEEESSQLKSYTLGLRERLEAKEAECVKLKETKSSMEEKYEQLRYDHDSIITCLEEYRKQLQTFKDEATAASEDRRLDKENVALVRKNLHDVNSTLKNAQSGIKEVLQQMLRLHDQLLGPGKMGTGKLLCGSVRRQADFQLGGSCTEVHGLDGERTLKKHRIL